ncbi:hypothetical protein V8G54_028818 [Vigna mungo]|uniref:Uncharacterized protein n=1 Tax=Vigna mungo TaxID=3915 RepID=A0AAQ3MSY7_VIGMU
MTIHVFNRKKEISEKAENTRDNVEVVINVENKVVGKEDEVCVPCPVILDKRPHFLPLNTDLPNIESFYHQDALKSYAHEKDKLLDDITTDGLFLLALLNRSLDAQPQQNTYFLTGKHGMPLVNAFSGFSTKFAAILIWKEIVAESELGFVCVFDLACSIWFFAFGFFAFGSWFIWCALCVWFVVHLVRSLHLVGG